MGEAADGVVAAVRQAEGLEQAGALTLDVGLGEAVQAAGLPPGVVNIVNGSGPDVPAALVDSPDVNMISFTGSSPVGAKIMENGGKTMKRLLMELGGKGAAVVTEDADIGQAAQAIATVWGFHSGQICTAPTRHPWPCWSSPRAN